MGEQTRFTRNTRNSNANPFRQNELAVPGAPEHTRNTPGTADQSNRHSGKYNMNTEKLPAEVTDAALIELLVVGKSPIHAAAELGTSHSAVYRRLSDPQFIARLAEARANRLQPYLARVEIEADASINKLCSLRDTATSEAIQLKASESLLNLLFRLSETVDVKPILLALKSEVESVRKNR